MHDPFEPQPSASRLPGPVPRSPAQAAASRANARHSTGPRTRLGKLHIRHNGVRHGLYTATAPMMGERRRDYAQVLEQLTMELQPDTPYEESLVSRAASLVWRLGRVPAAENALFESFGAEAAQVLDAGPDGETADPDAPQEIGIDLLWGLAFRSGTADSAVNRLARWERGLHRQLREVMAELRATRAARRQQAERHDEDDATTPFRPHDELIDESYTELDTYIALRDSALTRKELEEEVIRLRAQLAARDGLAPPTAPLHQVGNVPQRREEEIQGRIFTGHIKGECHGSNWDWSPAPEEAAHIQALIAEALGGSAATRASAPAAHPLAQEDRGDVTGLDDPAVQPGAAGPEAAASFAPNPSPEAAARGLPPTRPNPGGDTAFMDTEKTLRR